MTKYTRITGKVFGSSADPVGTDPNIGPEIGQFGSALAGTYNGTADVATIQNLPAWQDGFISAVTPNTQFPPLPEMTGFGKVLSYQLCYLLQQGVAEYDSGTTYYEGNWVSYNKALYINKSNTGTTGVLPTNTTYWTKFTGGSGRNLGEYVTSSLPLTDTTLHLADGALLAQTDYPELFSYISSIYIAPTITQYYAWGFYEYINYYVFYTLSSTPSIGDKIYDENFVEAGTVTSVSSGSITIYVNSFERTFSASRYSGGDTSQSVYPQSFFTTEADWQATYTAYGECGKYVYDSGNNTLRIPSLCSYFTNTNSATNLGVSTPASLPNIKGTMTMQESGVSATTDAFTASNTIQIPNGNNENTNNIVSFNAGGYNSIYSDSATTVNTQSVKQLVYIVVKQ